MAIQFENGLTLSGLAERNAELVTEVEKLRAERDASLNAERVWEKTMMEVCGEDGPASVAAVIKALAAENVGLKQYALDCFNAVENFNSWADKEDQIHNDMETPATDLFAVRIKADGVEEFVSNTVHKIFDESEAVSALTYRSLDNSHVKQLREGAK
ncbi:hypothetical protein KR75_27550 [Klebsiella variicola]|uniref:hypothetical protein n=1 Tax=Klebsiella variicola TaxID=244366 RepID=UPI00068E0ED9|nr:hypothetical protein [Klebsiella variicola]ANR76470.1 hypothetical protein KR75_27550 [Klebsiella variicola]